MIPLVGAVQELEFIREEALGGARRGAAASTVPSWTMPIGTMIELPRAALTAGEIAGAADFFSFGTNDLTQTTWGFSRDDVEAAFFSRYLDLGIFGVSPFESLDVVGVGRLVRIAVEEGRAANPDLHLGICGEHGGDPDSVHFCHQVGLDYVSCSPFRVPGGAARGGPGRGGRAQPAATPGEAAGPGLPCGSLAVRAGRLAARRRRPRPSGSGRSPGTTPAAQRRAPGARRAQFDGRPSEVFAARLRHAQALYLDGVAPVIVTVGGKQPGDRFTEGGAGRRYLVEQGRAGRRPWSRSRPARTPWRACRRPAAVLDGAGWAHGGAGHRPLALAALPRDRLRPGARRGHLADPAGPGRCRAGATQVRYIVRETAAYLYYRLFGRGSGGRGPAAV